MDHEQTEYQNQGANVFQGQPYFTPQSDEIGETKLGASIP
jgi:hypothetical protein